MKLLYYCIHVLQQQLDNKFQVKAWILFDYTVLRYGSLTPDGCNKIILPV